MKGEKSSKAEFIYCYSRRDALADGIHIDVSKTAAEAGIRFPVFITRTIYERFVAVPEGVQCQDEAGRLWDILWMCRHGIANAPEGQNPVTFELYVRNSNDQPAQLVSLIAECGAMDFDDPKPAITIYLPEDN